MSEHLSACSEPLALPVDDQLRLLGAVVDALLSCVLFASSFVAMEWIRSIRGEMLSLSQAVAVLVFFWALDVLIYALPLTLIRASLGNLLTCRRVVDASGGGSLTFARAVRRYFARRRVLRWFVEAAHRSAERRERMGPGSNFPGVPIPGSGYAAVLADAIVATMQGPIGPAASVADRSVDSAVIRSRSRS